MASLLELLKIIILKKMPKRQLKMQKKYSNTVKIRYPPSEKNLIEILKQNIHKLIESVPDIKKVILFGSYARERPHYGSDVDLLIIVREHSTDDFEKIYGTLFDISLEYEWSPIILSEDRYNQLKKTNNSFLASILEDGINIWAED
ncbi:MAG: nucleotidyltransferase domain-containing protein [Promethearchaeota archaeon]|nr:MAG: nucleotidyltransferase domain-containing protein [Candidatus Lokiarchaeota archaeon]